MAAPHVSGVAAQLLAEDPTLSVARVKEMILAAAEVDYINLSADAEAAGTPNRFLIGGAGIKPVCWGFSSGQYLPGCVSGDNCMNHGSITAAKAACIAAGAACGGVTHTGGRWEIRAGSLTSGSGDHAYPMGNSYCTTPCWGDVDGHYLPGYVVGGVDAYDFGSLAAAKTACIAKGTLCGGVLHAESGAWQIRSKTSKDLVAYGPEHAYPKTANWDHENAYCPR